MIHHLSIPARNPEHVARVLAELLDGYAGPFIGPIPNAWAAYAPDEHGTGIEVLPESTTLVPGAGDAEGTTATHPPTPAFAVHALISVPIDRAGIERIGAREGWRTRHFWRGPRGIQLFELYEMWLENRVLVELVTADMLAAYVATVRPERQRELLARLRG